MSETKKTYRDKPATSSRHQGAKPKAASKPKGAPSKGGASSGAKPQNGSFKAAKPKSGAGKSAASRPAASSAAKPKSAKPQSAARKTTSKSAPRADRATASRSDRATAPRADRAAASRSDRATAPRADRRTTSAPRAEHITTAATTNAPKSASSLCPVSDKCGGCQMVEIPYEQQLERKQQAMCELFAPIAPNLELLPILGMDEPFYYRNKVASPYAPGRKLPAGGKGARQQGARREILTGMYALGTHKLVPTDTCLLENKTAKAITLAIRDLMKKWDIQPYDEDEGTGFMRHAVVRVGHNSGEVLVTLVTNQAEFPSSKSFCRELVKRCPSITTVVQNINTRQTNVILGTDERTLYGPGFILDTLCGLSFRISSHSFYQVNSTQTEVLYEQAIALAQLGEGCTAIDAYCGTGTIGLVAASRGAARVIGVDSVKQAIVDAKQNARHNGIENAEFVAADATEFMRDLASQRKGVDLDAPDELVLFMDPPRAGSTPEFLDAAAVLAPARIVYISCNPETQVRDIAHLQRAGYRLEVVQPVDMFPHTNHVETVVLLTRDGRAAAWPQSHAAAKQLHQTSRR